MFIVCRYTAECALLNIAKEEREYMVSILWLGALRNQFTPQNLYIAHHVCLDD